METSGVDDKRRDLWFRKFVRVDYTIYWNLIKEGKMSRPGVIEISAKKMRVD